MSVLELIELKEEAIRLEYENKIQRLNDELEVGSIGDSKWLKNRLNIQSLDLIKERILYPFRKELEGKIVYYADKKGVQWRINKQLFNQWMVDNFSRIDWGNKQ